MAGNVKKTVGVSEKSTPIRKEMIGNIGYNSNDRSYLDYISRVYGSEDTSVNFFESLLLHNGVNFISNYKDTSVIHTPRVGEALSGEITTNPNVVGVKYTASVYDPYLNWGFNGSYVDDLKKSDTRLGVIGNTMYSNSLYKQAVDGTARGRNLYQGLTGQSPYITPYLFYEYGDNISTIEHLGDIMPVDPIRGIAINNFDDNTRIKYYEQVNREENGNYDILQSQFGRYLREKGKYIEGDPENGLYSNNSTTGRFIPTPLNTKISSESSYTSIGEDKTLHYVYDDGLENNSENFDKLFTSLTDSQFDEYVPVNTEECNDIVSKTQKLFTERKLKQLIGGYYMGTKDVMDSKEIDSALDGVYGHSRGRNLFNSKRTEENRFGFKDPYCRSWTYLHQYDRLSRAIRPFVNGNGEAVKLAEIQDKFSKYRSYIETEDKDVKSGGAYLAKYSVLRDNGFVKIGLFEHDLDQDFKDFHKRATDIHKYMLSIENLAWRDFQGDIEINRKGPNGGRIMWFPPYGLDFQESVNVQWNENNFIGRGEKMYTYTNTTRTAQLSFIIIIDHPVIAQQMSQHAGNQIFNGSTDEKSDGGADGDILRYFAGCDSFNFVQEKEPDTPRNQPSDQIEGNIVPQKSEGIVEQFAVFFPNNYSGYKDKPDEPNGFDADLGEYLIFGKNVNVNDNTNTGYEIDTNELHGISYPEDSGNTNEYIQACDDRQGVDVDQECQKPFDDPTRRFLYRVDYNLRQKGLNVSGNTTSYQDRVSLGLNGSIEAVKTKTNGHFNDNTCSFLEFMYAMALNQRDNPICAKIISKGGPIVNMDTVNRINNYLNTHTVKHIITQGGATNQDSPNSQGLARQRAKNIGNYLKQFFNDAKVTISKETFTFTSGTENIKKLKSVDTVQAKYQRSAQVKIVFDTEEISDVGNLFTEEEKKQQGVLDVAVDITNTMANSAEQTNSSTRGYEYEYFKELSVNDPFVFKSIKDKFKYFDPAFHSLSPEGFNARLNFLHQCTRQGHTVSASDPKTVQKAVTAGNLSFGRMPVCVLRIGDFINSRMIIESMSIQFSTDGIQWDLNPEGIGVQPMYAKVSLNVILLGGSALNYPINRLQNAQTFDYYANTGVYDSRADRISINEENGELQPIYTHIYTPNYQYKLQ